MLNINAIDKGSPKKGDIVKVILNVCNIKSSKDMIGSLLALVLE